ncbi:MAG: NAD-dependent epimerase/dehydratase family protein [Chthoniobacteraceae bacterium]
MKVLVTGGAGFIGSHLVEHYQHKAEVVVLDNFRTGHRQNLKGLNCKIIQGSVLDASLLHRILPNTDYIFHLAALVSVPESISRPKETVEINTLGLLTVLEAARLHRVKKLCFASSAAVYGEDPECPKLESMLPMPRSPYGITKLDGEHYCAFYSSQGWLKTAALRFFNVFGPRQDPEGPYAAAVAAFIQRALLNDPITIFGDGRQTRDFVYVKDIVGALSFLAAHHDATGIYNAGYGKSIAVIELARAILAETGSSSKLVHASQRAGDVRESVANARKLINLGWQPTHGVKEGLAETIHFYAEQTGRNSMT